MKLKDIFKLKQCIICGKKVNKKCFIYCDDTNNGDHQYSLNCLSIHVYDFKYNIFIYRDNRFEIMRIKEYDTLYSEIINDDFESIEDIKSFYKKQLDKAIENLIFV